MSCSSGLKHWVAKRAEDLLYRMGGLPITVCVLLHANRSDSASQIRRAYAARYWQLGRWQDAVEIALAILLWPAAVLLGSLYLTCRNGNVVARQSGRSILLQFADQLRFAFCEGILPPWYYIFALHDRDRADHAATFLNRCETKRGVFPTLREPVDETIEFDDKCLFAKLCRSRVLPTVPVLAVAADGEWRWQEADDLPASDLFVKPVDGCGGKGAERWDCRGDRYEGKDGSVVTRPELIDLLTIRGCARALVVQPRVTNHLAMSALSNGALCTMRLLTCLEEHGAPEIMGAVCRMAVGKNRTVDNFHAGGIASQIDLGSGKLSKATDLGLMASVGWLDAHPDTGAVITGRSIPDWPSVCALALRAHRAFSNHILVGWDIALLEDGPCLVEGNGGPDVDLMQRHRSHGLMEERFAELLAWHLRQQARAANGCAVSHPQPT
jgi:hypothetical protein